jgi:hypothetical protein
MSSIDILKSKRASGYGGTSQSTESTTGSVNRSFPLSEKELSGLGEGPYSLRAKGHIKNGHFHIKEIETPLDQYSTKVTYDGDSDEDEEE